MSTKGSRRWWAMALLPAMAISACGGSRLSHDAIVAAVNGGPLPTAQAQPSQQGAVSTTPQNGAIASPPHPSGVGGVSSDRAGNATSASSRTGASVASALSGGTSQVGAAAGSGPTAARPAGPLAPILLGNVGTYSGPIGSSSAGTDTVVRVWAEWTNAHGGIAGHPVQVYTADDGGDPSKSLTVVKDMVETKHVVAFVSNILPITMQGDIDYLHAHNIPMVGGDNVTAAWTSDSMAFPEGTTILESVLGDLKLAHRRNLAKVGILYCAEVPTCKYMTDYAVKDGASRAGENVVYQAQVSVAQPDYTAACLGAQSAGAQVLDVILDAASIRRLAASCSRQGYHPAYMAVAVQTTVDLQSVPELDGMFITSPVFPFAASDTPATANFHEAVQQYAPNLILTGNSAVAWASGQLLAKAAGGIGAQPTSQDILRGLWRMHNETLDGLAPPLRYVEGQPSPVVQCYFVMEIRDGRWTAPSGSAYSC